jgi:hypothetical protein
MNQEELIKIEQLESKYLKKYYHFLKFAEDELMFGFKTKFKIKDDWIKQWNPSEEGKGISDFALGAERIVYSLLNGKGIGQPNSAPIGSDLFFEVQDAFIHIDLKTVQTRNIGDYTKDIFVGNNQNSYKGKLDVNNIEKEYIACALPYFYTVDGIKKPCLTYFITILYEETNLQILNINLLSMPNGLLYDVYGKEPLKAGKISYGGAEGMRFAKSIRFQWSKVKEFKLLNNESRVKVIYLKNNIDDKYKNKLKFIFDIHNQQNEY